MEKSYSQAEDCIKLAHIFKVQLGEKIDYYNLGNIPGGKYLSSFRINNGEYMFNGRYLPFYFKFNKDSFLRISVGENYKGSSLGEKLAALSDFYAILSEQFGEPTVFYTTKDDDEKLLSLQWSFANKDEEISKFKSGTYFDDAEIDKLIVFGEKENNLNGYKLNDTTKSSISKQVGLPFELLYLVDEDMENFVKHKNGRELTIPNSAKIDGVPVTSFERKLAKNS